MPGEPGRPPRLRRVRGFSSSISGFDAVVDRLKEGLAANSQLQAVVFSPCLKSGEDPVADDNAGKRPVPLVSRADTERLDLGHQRSGPALNGPCRPI